MEPKTKVYDSVIGGAYVKEGKRSLELGADDLYDRIINLKFIRKSGKSFIIRSDYEPVFYPDGTVGFKKCVQKPDIKVTYYQVAETTAVKVDIEVVNLFTLGGEVTGEMYTVTGDPVVWCVIQMGYRGQFPDWTKPDRSSNIQQYYDLNNSTITADKEVRRGNQIQVQILTGYQKSYPPDMVTYFQGIVGSVEQGLRMNLRPDQLVKGFGDADFPKGKSEIEDVFFQFVTRRFVKPAVTHRIETTQKHTNKEALEGEETEWEQVIKIYELPKYYVSDFRYGPGITEEDRWEELPLNPDGIMFVEDAKKFGVRCYVSQTLRLEKADSLFTYTIRKTKESVELEIPTAMFNETNWTVEDQLASIQGHYPFLRWYQMFDGNYYVYHVKDTDTDLFDSPYVEYQRRNNLVFLPAIYDMTPAGTRTIRCPFISFLNPMMTVIFETRYTLGTLTSFFYTPKTNAFLVITSQVEFATVQDNNVMELTCVDSPPHKLVIDPDTGLPDKYNEYPDDYDDYDDTPLDEGQDKRYQWWEEVLDTVVQYHTGDTRTLSRWENIVDLEMTPHIDYSFWEEGHPTRKELLQLVLGWNNDLVQKNLQIALSAIESEKSSRENDPGGIGYEEGVEVSWIYKDDKIVLRRPVRPDYPPDQRIDKPA